MSMKLITITTSDNLNLPGILFEPVFPTTKVAIFLHGNGSRDVFDQHEAISAVAKQFTDSKIAYLAFNNRGARYIQKFKYVADNGNEQIMWGGMTYEKIKECIYDIDAAVDYLLRLGYIEFYLIGASTGANKAVVYNYYKPKNAISKFIISAPGDDTGIYYESLGNEEFKKVLAFAKQKIDAGLGLEIAETRFYGTLFSYQALYDTLNPDGDYNIFSFYEAQNKRVGTKELFQEFKSLKKPTLVLLGAADEYCKPNAQKCLNIVKEQTQNRNNFTFTLINDADHSFTGKFDEVAAIELKFLLR